MVASTCHRRVGEATAPPPKPALGAVSVQDVSPEGAELDLPALERGLRDKLLATGLFTAEAPDAGQGAVTRVRAVISAETVEVGKKGEARAHVRIAATSRPTDAPGALELDVEGQGAAPYTLTTPTRAGRRANAAPTAAAGKDGQPALAPLVLRVAGDLLDGYVARRRLRGGTPSEIHTALMADGGELREEAIRTVGERKLQDEAPTLLKMLDDPDEPTRDAALGSLIALGDRRAVSVLTRSRSLRDRHEMRKIIEAIAILGGQEADDYLSFVADTHDDEEIRSAASRARARIAHHDVDSGAH